MGFPLKRLFNDYSYHNAFPRAYERAAKGKSVNPHKAVFLSEKLDKLPDSFSLMLSYMCDELGFQVKFCGLGQNTGISRAEYFKRCRQFAEEVADARLVFLDDSSRLLSCLPLRAETKAVQLWHACGAFKKWGASTFDVQFGPAREEGLRYPHYKNLSLVTVSSSEVAWAYVEAMSLQDTPQVVQPLGVSRTDVYFDKTFLQDARAALEQAIPAVAGKKILLYAPTYRGSTTDPKAPDALDISAVRNALGDEWSLVIRHHPYIKQTPAILPDCTDFAFYAPDEMSTSQLLAAADMLLTDYSSVVFEYALLTRPMAFFAYDKDTYIDERGFYYDYEDMTPGPVAMSMQELSELLADPDSWFDPAEILAFKDQFMSACDGHAAERIAQTALRMSEA